MGLTRPSPSTSAASRRVSPLAGETMANAERWPAKHSMGESTDKSTAQSFRDSKDSRPSFKLLFFKMGFFKVGCL